MLENAILFIGLGKNKYKLDEITEIGSDNSIIDNYGHDSCFYDAIETARLFGVENISVLNLDSWENIKRHKELLRSLEYDYIVPLDLYIDELYYDSYYDKMLFYSQLLLLTLHKTISTLVLCGKHASGYDTLTEYLESEYAAVKKAQPAYKNLTAQNLLYVANNLEEYRYSNVVAASVLATSDYNEYPKSSLFGKTVFDIDYCDVKIPMAFFKDNHLTGTTIENLVNFSTDETLKIVTVNKILHYFHYHKPDIERYIGTTYTEYKKFKIAEILDDYLKNLVGYIITDYKINSVTDILTEVGAVDIHVQYDIWPRFTTERYKLETGL